MAQRDVIIDAMRRAEPAVAAGAEPYAATGLTFAPPNVVTSSQDAHNACVAECPHILAALIEKYGVHVNRVVEGTWETLLIASALSGSTKCIAVLLSHGADVNLVAASETGLASPLFAAAEYGHVAVCRQLLEAGANIEFREFQTTPLHFAAQFGNVGVVALLMQRGADTKVMNSDLCTPIMMACGKQQLLCVRALLPHADLTHHLKKGSSLLHIAAAQGGPAVLEVVLARYVEAGLVDIPTGVDASNKTHTGRTPLMYACVSAKYAEAKMLLKAGASRYANDSEGCCPLRYCILGDLAVAVGHGSKLALHS
jgi:ankyrin repeat protein